MTNANRIHIFTGHFGSGKTEIAVNYACKLSQAGHKTAIVDFDIVNPYFRTADAMDALRQQGIRVVVPPYANTNVDVPALPAEINTLFEDPSYQVVFDVGGDDLGAKVLSRYLEAIQQQPYEMFFVINPKRPMTDTQDKILEMLAAIQESARLKVTQLVNNTNLLADTTPQDVLEGQQLVETVANRLSLPVGFIAGFKEVIEPLRHQLSCPLFFLDRHIQLPWEKEQVDG